MKHIYEHFSKQFSIGENQSGCAEVEDPIQSISNTLTEEEARSLVEPINAEEILTTLKACSKKKSPGPDGITYEFYLENFETVKDDLVLIFNSYVSGNVQPPKEFCESIITLIPKSGDQSLLENHRPISLLNADYKLFTKLLANRISSFLNRLLGPGQTAGLRELSCIDNLKDVRRILTRSMESKKFKGFMLSIDLEKAFDNVNHAYLWKILEKFGFPEQMVTCLKNLYGQASSRVLYKGFLTPEFAIKSSVRQGCPLSMILFTLYIEPLIRAIHLSSSGVLVYGKFLKVIAFADDVTIFIKNQQEFDLVMQIILSYSLYANIRMNLKKSCFIRLNNASSGPQIIREQEKIKILGLIIHRTWSKMIDENYEKLINDMKFSIKINQTRNLNF